MSAIRRFWRNRVSRFVALAVLWLGVVLYHYSLVLETAPPSGQVPAQWRMQKEPDAVIAHPQHEAMPNQQQPGRQREQSELHGVHRQKPDDAEPVAAVMDLVRQEQKKQKRVQDLKVNRTYDDFTFNGVPITFQKGVTPAGRNRCIHDQPVTNESSSSSWMSRSCIYHNLCLDVDTHEYVLFSDDVDGNVTSVALGGINPRWTNRGFNMGVWKVSWAPTIIKQTKAIPGYYALPDDAVLIPFHSLAAHNIGHLLWDDFYPIFTLLRIFGLQDARLLLPLRHQIAHPLYANCDIRKNKRQQCQHNFDRFLPLLGVDARHFSTTKRAVVQVPPDQRQSPYVCARQAVAGLGFLTDHGWHDHGWESQGHRPHNLARGPTFAAFGAFLVRHVLGDRDATAAPSTLPPPRPVRVVFSRLSSRYPDRRLDFAVQLSYLRNTTTTTGPSSDDPPPPLQIDDYALWELSLPDQIRLARRQTHIFVTSCGGGVMTATFLPPGAALVLYYNPTGGYDFRRPEDENDGETGGPARLDWDLFNNAGHLRVHWLPITSMDSAEDLELLSLLLEHEADVISRQSLSRGP